MQPDLMSTNVPQRFISEYTHIFPIPNVTVHFLANYLLASKVLIEISLCDMLSQIYLNLIYGQPLEDHRKKKYPFFCMGHTQMGNSIQMAGNFATVLALFHLFHSREIFVF